MSDTSLVTRFDYLCNKIDASIEATDRLHDSFGDEYHFSWKITRVALISIELIVCLKRKQMSDSNTQDREMSSTIEPIAFECGERYKNVTGQQTLEMIIGIWTLRVLAPAMIQRR